MLRKIDQVGMGENDGRSKLMRELWLVLCQPCAVSMHRERVSSFQLSGIRNKRDSRGCKGVRMVVAVRGRKQDDEK